MAYLLKTMSRSSLTYTLRRGFASAPLVYSEEVQKAKTTGQSIVALESTIITHGMPYPNNLQTALEVEDIIRERVSFYRFTRVHALLDQCETFIRVYTHGNITFASLLS